MIGATTPKTTTVFHGIFGNTVANDLNTPTAERSEKAFKSLQAACALAGHTLTRY